eukprot:GHRR01024374.1.p1 GENE.GHRR01024374.1~~GHRR01024374.1.p1  ORF type:complete len:261 (+),score=61.45 GHRR01024374.1:603-1385(+)
MQSDEELLLLEAVDIYGKQTNNLRMSSKLQVSGLVAAEEAVSAPAPALAAPAALLPLVGASKVYGNHTAPLCSHLVCSLNSAAAAYPLGLRRTIPLDILPHSISEPIKPKLTNHRIPAAMLYCFDSKTRRRTYTIVEIRYCTDTKPQHQETRAQEQHSRLEQASKQYGPNADVNYYALMLGVSGVMYDNFFSHMRRATNVDGPLQTPCLSRLYHTATHSMEKYGSSIEHLPANFLAPIRRASQDTSTLLTQNHERKMLIE